MGIERDDSYELFIPDIYLLNELYKTDCSINYRVNDDEGGLILSKSDNSYNSIEVKVKNWKYMKKDGKYVLDLDSIKFHIFLYDKSRIIINYPKNKDVLHKYNNVEAYKEYGFETAKSIILRYLDNFTLGKTFYENIEKEVNKLPFDEVDKNNLLGIFCHYTTRIDKFDISKTEILYFDKIEDELLKHFIDRCVRFKIKEKVYLIRLTNNYPLFIADNEANEYLIDKNKVFLYEEEKDEDEYED